MVNNWQDAVRHCIRVNNMVIERLNRKLAMTNPDDDMQQAIRLTRINERELANNDLQMLLEEYGDEWEK